MTLYIVCFCFSACFAAAFLMSEGKINRAINGCIKAIATLLLAIPAYNAYAVSDNVVFLLIAVGITLCACADYVIHFHFLPGAVIFAAAHCVFAPAFIIYGSKLPYAVAMFVLFSVCCAFGLTKTQLQPVLRFPAVLYGAVIGVMFSFAFGASLYGDAFGIVSAFSAALFVASDAILAFGLGKPKCKKRDVILMLLYYLAISGFALACLL